MGPSNSDPKPAETNATRSSLLRRLRDWEDQDSWRDFFEAYWKLIYNFALRCGLSDADARDVVQETVVAIAKNLQQGRFRIGEGSFRSWLLHITRRRIADHFRERRVECLGEEAENATSAPIEELAAPAEDEAMALWDEEWNRNLAEAALERVRRRVRPKQYQMFDLYVVKQCRVADVARTLHVSIAQVYLAKHRITRLANKELTRLQKAAENEGPGAFRKATVCA